MYTNLNIILLGRLFQSVVGTLAEGNAQQEYDCDELDD